MFAIKIFEYILKSVCLESCLKFLGTAAVVLSAALLLWHFLAPERPEADRPRKNVADKAMVKLMEDLRAQRGEIKEIAVMHFKNDGSDYVTQTLRKKLATSGIFEVAEADMMEKITIMLKLRNRGSFSTEEAVRYGRKFEVQAVITGILERFESMKGGAVIRGTVRIIGIPDGKLIAEIPVRESTVVNIFGKRKSSAAVNSVPAAPAAAGFPWHIRFLIFVMSVLLLPVLTISFLRCICWTFWRPCSGEKRSSAQAAEVLT